MDLGFGRREARSACDEHHDPAVGGAGDGRASNDDGTGPAVPVCREDHVGPVLDQGLAHSQGATLAERRFVSGLTGAVATVAVALVASLLTSR